MNKHTILLTILVLGLTLFAQEIQHEAIAVNIEVPVRVFKGKNFIDNLTIDDFEIYEDGILQKTEAVYLINKMDIVREDTEMKKEEARKIYAPKVARNFVFLFEMHEYLPTVGKAIELFFDDIFLKGDTLLVVTPSQSYNFDNTVLDKLTEKEISKQLIAQLRKDLRLSSSEYRGLLIDLEDLRKYQGSGAIEPDLVRLMHSAILTKLTNLKYIDEKKMINFADNLERVEGPKHVFFFLQKLVVPTMGTDSVDLRGFQSYMSFNENKIKQIFSSSSITAHMVYVTKISDSEFVSSGGKSLTSTNIMNSRNPQPPRVMQDLSGDFFSAFKDIAEATGGIVESTTNVAASFKKAADASENYYLLYYSPKNYIADGKFKEIKIKVKDQRYKISHRAGYIAD
ncbi:hypothetical protein ACFLQZ_03845 [Acidobacteriota bacterium]